MHCRKQFKSENLRTTTNYKFHLEHRNETRLRRTYLCRLVENKSYYQAEEPVTFGLQEITSNFTPWSHPMS